MGRILITSHARRNLIGVCYLVRKAYFKAEIVETAGFIVGHLGQFEVVGGYDAAHGQARNGLKEHPRTVQFVQRIGAFEYLVEDDKRIAVSPQWAISWRRRSSSALK